MPREKEVFVGRKTEFLRRLVGLNVFLQVIAYHQ